MSWIVGLIMILILVPQPNLSSKKKSFFLKESEELKEMESYAKKS